MSGGLFRAASESGGRARDEGARRGHVMEFDAEVQDGCLHTHWIYSENLHRHESIEALAREFQTALDQLIECSRTAQPSYTPSDFPLIQADQDELDEALTGVEFEGFSD